MPPVALQAPLPPLPTPGLLVVPARAPRVPPAHRIQVAAVSALLSRGSPRPGLRVLRWLLLVVVAVVAVLLLLLGAQLLRLWQGRKRLVNPPCAWCWPRLQCRCARAG